MYSWYCEPCWFSLIGSSYFYSKVLLPKEKRNLLLVEGLGISLQNISQHTSGMFDISGLKKAEAWKYGTDGYQWNQSNKNPLNQLYAELNELFCVHNGIPDPAYIEGSLYWTRSGGWGM